MQLLTMVNKSQASECRKALLDSGLSTKILPEATSWHFAVHWDHMPELKQLKNKNSFKISQKILEKSVSIPINVFMESKVPKVIRLSLQKVFEK